MGTLDYGQGCWVDELALAIDGPRSVRANGVPERKEWSFGAGLAHRVDTADRLAHRAPFGVIPEFIATAPEIAPLSCFKAK